MIIQKEIAVRNFQPWAGAKQVFNRLTTEELDTLDELLSKVKTYDKTEINDIFWFEDEWICETLGIDYEKFWKREAEASLFYSSTSSVTSIPVKERIAN